jgi:hypothetical protein
MDSYYAPVVAPGVVGRSEPGSSNEQHEQTDLAWTELHMIATIDDTHWQLGLAQTG